MSIFEQEISKQISAMVDIPADQVIQCVEAPKNKDLADFALPLPKLNRFKKLAGAPNQLVNELANKFVCNDLITKVSVSGIYLNFNVNRLQQTSIIIKQVLAEGDRFGVSQATFDANQEKHIILEFSSPNIAKPFHAGHLRSTIIGNFLVNLHRAVGYKVTSMNYLGDWGKQYGLLAIGFERFGSEEELQKDPIAHLFHVYVKINAQAETEPSIHDDARSYFKRMEDGDVDALAIWKRFRDVSIEKYKAIYARLNVSFDIYSGESLMCDGMVHAYDKLVEKNLVIESEGAKVIDLEAYKLGKVLVKKKDGSTLYITRDIAAANYRKEDLKFDKMIYVVASQQELHFRQLFKIVETMGYEWSKDLTHIGFGMVKGMSTRKGTVVFLEDILNESKQIMGEVMKKNEAKYAEIEKPDEVADILAVSAVVIQDFSAKRNKDYDFNWDRMLSFEGDTGPYLQYAHARLCSMERKNNVAINKDADLGLLTEPEAYTLAVTIGRYGDVLQGALNNLEPNVVATYLFELCHAISSAHSVLYVKDREQNLAEARTALFHCAKIILGNGLRILGLVPLERM
ncbi:arginyl-tRNA synthetase [Cavenderia fasciculata]|uniref:arginine--tRNA ligase n=1 Tax=Cavenderia fasciculata TaxID=261658 RepID=F4QAV9_CACFS|nr:arginyl-tRNA synthetase [Cavenderia fasciculata]EGG15018.1 arginyl-tRNA synthetase [Cavenderia fasciculata]|eukprot:XP_004351738.1 arginyl-tRNA synthetase [Cavenderia fasciculata]